MREIELRFFNPTDKACGKPAMTYERYSSYEGQGLNEQIKALQEIGIIVIQHIGRKDKNNKKIFEGDIIEITALTGAEGLAPGFVFYKLRVEVRWDNENALWSFNLDADWSAFYDEEDKRAMISFRNSVRTLMFDGETGEIKGNKFENPELLKGG